MASLVNRAAASLRCLRILLGAYQPPLTVVGGEVIYHLDGEEMNAADMTEEEQRDLKWRTISYIPQGSMHVLNPVRRIRDTFHDFISAHRDVTKKRILSSLRRNTCAI